ncbi:MAG TPA: 2-C-methyl-D-erythritol 4-phosphate cytidylyltransferase [Nocardioidaceae bacterium]|nr:2-C-methyl-D-erythritol 4-phosphate cytidylyltransferase [Nocardioidaceae bacterium]
MSQATAAVIPAAGAGVRLAAGAPEPPKALRSVAGRALLELSVDALAPLVDEVIVVAPPNFVDPVQGVLGNAAGPRVVAGGSTRQESVRLGLAALGPAAAYVVVHDAARPLVPPDLVQRVLDALLAGAEAVVPVLPVTDSLRRRRPDGDSEPVDRESLVAVQTPQGFRREVLERAHSAAAGHGATDDASLVQSLGVRVATVDGSPLAFKVTTRLDLLLVEALVTTR